MTTVAYDSAVFYRAATLHPGAGMTPPEAAAGKDGGTPAEDFAETFRWYIASQSGTPFIPMAGQDFANPWNLKGLVPNDGRINALKDMLARF